MEEKASSSLSASSSSSQLGDGSEPNSSSSGYSNGGEEIAETSSSHDGNGGSAAATTVEFSLLSFFRSSIPAILELSGLLSPSNSLSRHFYSSLSEDHAMVNDGAGPEVSIQIISSGDGVDRDSESDTTHLTLSPSSSSSSVGSSGLGLGIGDFDGEAGNVLELPTPSSSTSSSSHQQPENQRHDLQQLARWLEHTLPFSLLLLLVFVRQYLLGFFLTIWIAAVMFKCNSILQKQTALKGDRKILVLFTISIVSILHVSGVYCWYQDDDLLYPLVMLPPKEVPQFWHAIFIIMVNDTLMRQVAMIFKCLVLMYYKNGRGHNYRRQAQMLTLVEHAILFYRTLIPTPVWYRFFLGNDYGSLFASLTTGLYLTFKLTFVVEKVQAFYASIRVLSQKEVHYGSHATSEQVKAIGDLCAICQEKMHTPILLRCKHIFCEDCVSEWLERERTCPLCRAVVKPSDLQSFGDGSTSLFYQLF